jgi:hypothetical protein
MFPEYAWMCAYDSIESFKLEVGPIEYRGPGWYRVLKDFLLILKDERAAYVQEDNSYMPNPDGILVYVWSQDPREAWNLLSEMPEFEVR